MRIAVSLGRRLGLTSSCTGMSLMPLRSRRRAIGSHEWRKRSQM
jgi:hypothetical protein